MARKRNSQQKDAMAGRDRSIIGIFTRRIVILLVVFALLLVQGAYIMETDYRVEEAERDLSRSLNTLEKTVTANIDDTLINNLQMFMYGGAGETATALFELTEKDIEDMNGNGRIDAPEVNAYLRNAKDLMFVEEVSIVSPEGIITYSSENGVTGKNILVDEEMADLFHKTIEYSAYVPHYTAEDNDRAVVYAGLAFPMDCWAGEKNSVLMYGWKSEHIVNGRQDAACTYAQNMNVCEDGSFLILGRECREDGAYPVWGEYGSVSYRSNAAAEAIDYLLLPIDKYPPRKMFETSVRGENCYCIYDQEKTFIYLAMVPVREVLSEREGTILRTLLFLLANFAILGIVFFWIMQKEVISPVRRLCREMDAISKGNLDVPVRVLDNREFSMISDDINVLVLTLKQYIKEAESRIDKELALARAIQKSALPHTFPPFPNRKEFEIFASMDAAKEVGGDFYDYFFVDDDHLAIAMADVSNKGIPAAMFMMQAKARIRGRAKQGGTPAAILTDVNNALCKTNDEKLFVTVWFAIIEISTGKGLVVNAGHEHPAIYRDGEYRLVRYPHSLPLAVMTDTPFFDRSFSLMPGEKLFVYTDGITDAKDDTGAMFGDERLVEALNACKEAGPEETICHVRREIDAFVKDATQFDDITMCAFRYFGNEQQQ